MEVYILLYIVVGLIMFFLLKDCIRDEADPNTKISMAVSVVLLWPLYLSVMVIGGLWMFVQEIYSMFRRK